MTAVSMLFCGSWAGDAQQPADPGRAARGSAAFLFTYRPKPGHEADFDEGYRRHLAWHARAGDPLAWYGWYVTAGERLGVFIDGSFGTTFGAFDARVDPAADAEDFARTAGPFADALSRSVYRLRRDLSTAEPLESRTPPAAFDVVHIVARAGQQPRIERTLSALKARAGRERAAPRYAWYSLVVGGEQPSYLLLIPRERWADYDPESTPDVEVLLAALGDAPRRAWSERWTYRPDLSLVRGAGTP